MKPSFLMELFKALLHYALSVPLDWTAALRLYEFSFIMGFHQFHQFPGDKWARYNTNPEERYGTNGDALV